MTGNAGRNDDAAITKTDSSQSSSTSHDYKTSQLNMS